MSAEVFLILNSLTCLFEKFLITCRVDFVSFSIAQPDASTVCATDQFQISGISNEVPIICGDNDGQHSKYS